MMNALDKLLYCFIALFLIILSGCDLHDKGKTIVNIDQILNLERNYFYELSDLSNSNWEFVCVLAPYQELLVESGDERVSMINKKISEWDFLIAENIWYFLFYKENEVAFQAVNRANKIDIKQFGFSGAIEDELSESFFIPSTCLEFEDAILFSYSQNNRIQITLGVHGQ